MSPLEFKKAYLNISVPIICATDIVGKRINPRVAIKEYRNRSINFKASAKNKLISFMRRNNYLRSDRTAAARAFNGKASLAECKRALRAIWHSGHAGINLQNYCKANLGIDCSGFVNNYFLREYGMRKTSIPGYYQNGRANVRTNFNEFEAEDVLIWCHHSGRLKTKGHGRHIAIIDNVHKPHAGNELRASVVESTGRLGLVDSTYTFTSIEERPGVYSIHRPLKPSRRANYVRVVPII